MLSARAHAIFRPFVYITSMTVFLFSFLVWIAFQSAINPLLAYIVPPIIRAQYASAVTAATVSSPFLYTFATPGTLYEAGTAAESSSPYFWVNSGAKLIIEGGVGKTQQGALPAYDPWRLMYKSMNSLDSDYGYLPENTLRIVTRSNWGDTETSLLFRITATNLTNTPNRDGYSGIFLMGRYKDQYNLYYAGIRHDGAAVIKKKINGTYYTLAQAQIFGKEGEYHKWNNPNLLPQNVWTGLRMRITNQFDGSVKVQLLLDRENDGSFVSILSAVDKSTGGTAFKDVGALGIRTDFMDVEFDDFKAVKI